jgi:tetratricopeptide (TPR) repeat protein
MGLKTTYKVGRGGVILGTYDEPELVYLMGSGKILETDDFWTEGMQTWEKISSKRDWTIKKIKDSASGNRSEGTKEGHNGQAGRLQQRLADAVRLVTLHPNEFSYRYELGVLYIESGYLDSAVEQLHFSSKSPALRLYSKWAIGRAFMLGGKYDLAHEVLTDVKSEIHLLTPLKINVIYSLAQLYEKMGNSGAARSEYQQIQWQISKDGSLPQTIIGYVGQEDPKIMQLAGDSSFPAASTSPSRTVASPDYGLEAVKEPARVSFFSIWWKTALVVYVLYLLAAYGNSPGNVGYAIGRGLFSAPLLAVLFAALIYWIRK